MIALTVTSAAGFALAMNTPAPALWRWLLGLGTLANGLSAALWLY